MNLFFPVSLSRSPITDSNQKFIQITSGLSPTSHGTNCRKVVSTYFALCDVCSNFNLAVNLGSNGESVGDNDRDSGITKHNIYY